jgi:amidohydrolase
VPGFYFFVGVANPAKGITAMIHTEHFDIDEAALGVGMRAMATAVADFLYRSSAR